METEMERRELLELEEAARKIIDDCDLWREGTSICERQLTTLEASLANGKLRIGAGEEIDLAPLRLAIQTLNDKLDGRRAIQAEKDRKLQKTQQRIQELREKQTKALNDVRRSELEAAVREREKSRIEKEREFSNAIQAEESARAELRNFLRSCELAQKRKLPPQPIFAHAGPHQPYRPARGSR